MHWFGLPLASNNWFSPLFNARYFHFDFKVSDFWARKAEDVLIFLLKRRKTLHCIIDALSLPFIMQLSHLLTQQQPSGTLASIWGWLWQYD